MPEASLHHVGYVIASISDSIEGFRRSLGATAASQTFDDPIQRARVAFLALPAQGVVQLELVEPLTTDSPVARFLAKGGGLHHLCFEVDHLEAQIQHMREAKAMLIRSPKPAVAFNGRRICWMQTSERLLIEYLERDLT